MIDPKIDDVNCTAYLQKGNSAAYRYLINLYFPVLSKFVEKIIKADQQAAEDIVSDIFIKLWHKKADFTSFSHIRKFLYVSSKNSAINFLKKKEREKERNLIFTKDISTNEDFLFKEIVHSELIVQIRKAVESLPPRMREIFILSYIHGAQNQEIADKLKLSQQTVRNQKTKALTIVKKILDQSSITNIIAILLILKDSQNKFL